jgi:hypothetical protein
MSGPSHRINTEHKPSGNFPNVPWEGRVTRLSDGEVVSVTYGATEARVVEQAQAAIAALNSAVQPGRVLFAAEDGEITEGEVPEPELRVS